MKDKGPLQRGAKIFEKATMTGSENA